VIAACAPVPGGVIALVVHSSGSTSVLPATLSVLAAHLTVFQPAR
jgi:hypothetical protein